MLIRPFFRRPLAVVDNPGLEFANSVGVLRTQGYANPGLEFANSVGVLRTQGCANPGLEFANSVGVPEKALGGNAFISSSALREDR